MSTQAAPLAIQREVDVYVAIAHARDTTTGIGFNTVDRTKIEIMIMELTRNILRHAGSGELLVEPVTRGDLRGVLITARDAGPGIPDVARALEDGFSTAGTLGAGLPGVSRLADDFAIETEPGRGTVVKAWKWHTPPARGWR